MSGHVYEKTAGFIQTTVLPRISEIIQYMPESIFMGTLFISLCAMSNISWWILLFFQFQLIVTRRFMGFFTSTLFPTLTQINPNCESGYFINSKGIRVCILNMFGKGGSLPSPSLFFIAGLISYLYATLLAFKNEITNSGEDYSGRMITATVLSIVLLLIVFMSNINKGCNSFIGATTSVILGIFIGIIYYMVNSKVFGKENMNLPGLPVITEAAPSVAT